MTSFESNPNSTATQVVNSRSKRPLKLVLVLAIVMIVSLAGIGVAYAKFDVFKSPKAIYLESELSNLKSTKAAIADVKKQYDAEVKPLLDQPVHTVFDISELNVEAAMQDQEITKILDLIKKIKLGFDVQQDTNNNKTISKVNLHISNESLLNVEVAMDSEKMAIRIPELYAKYGYVNIKDLEALQKEFNTDRLPKRVLTYKDLVNAVYMTEEELSAALTPYTKIYADSILPEQVTLNKDGVLVEDGVQINARELTVTFNQTDLKRLVNNVADKMQADAVLQDLIYTRATKVIQLLNDSGYPTPELNKEEFVKEWKQAGEDMKKSVEKGNIADGAKMILYIDDNHKVLERKLAFKAKGSDGKTEDLLIKIGAWKSDSFLKNNLVFISSQDEAGQGGELKVLNTSNVGDSGGKGKLSLSFKEATSRTNSTTFIAEVDYDLQKSKEKDSGTYTIHLSVPGSGKDAGSIKGSITENVTKEGNKKDSTYEVKLNFSELPGASDFKGLSFKLHTKQEPIAGVSLPAMTADNSVDLANMTDAQREQLLLELGTGVQAFMEKNSELFESFGLPFGNMLGMPEDDWEEAEYLEDYSLEDLDIDLDSLTDEELAELEQWMKEMKD
ncbi:hypothetical protein D3C73_765090 [compost metagenome]